MRGNVRLNYPDRCSDCKQKDISFAPTGIKIKGLGSGKSVPMSSGIHFAQDGIVLTDFNLPRVLKAAFDMQVLKVRQVFSYADTLPIMIKIRDDLGGAVTNNG